MGAVDNPSSSKNMETIYSNMMKLFDAFTQGALKEQGANSTLLLRNVYRSLSDDFVKIVQNSKLVDKMVEMMKSKQDSLTADDLDSPMVSNTTKKVVTKTLDPTECNLVDVIVDFNSELQNDILQVKLNLSREHERQKLAQAKSYEGQQEDLDRLNKVVQEQNQSIVDAIGQVSDEQTKWKDKQLADLDESFKTLDEDGKGEDVLSSLQNDENLETLTTDNLKSLKLNTVQMDIKKVLNTIKGIQQQQKLNEKAFDIKNQPLPGKNSPDKPLQVKDESTGKEQDKFKDKVKPGKVQPPKEDNNKKKKEDEDKKPKDNARQSPMENPQPAGGNENKKKEGDKLKVSPSQRGKECICPICQTPHIAGQPHGDDHVGMGNKNQPLKPIKLGGLSVNAPGTTKEGGDDGKKKTSITPAGVVGALSQLQVGMTGMFKNKKFANAFMLNYGGVQKNIKKSMDKVNKYEVKIHKNLLTTEKGVKDLKKQAASKGGILQMFFGGIGSKIITVLGAIVLITLARMAMSKWAQTYMPQSDGSTMTILGFQIPGWSMIKSFGLGIWNWVTVGLPNWWNRIKVFASKIKRMLFGKKGMFKNMSTTWHTLRRLVGAFIIGQTKQVGGKIVSVILKIIGWALCWIPGVKPVCDFLAEFGPALFTFISTQIMLIWSKGKATAEQTLAADKAAQFATGTAMVRKLEAQIEGMGKGVKPFKEQLTNIPGLESAMGRKQGSGGPERKAILKRVNTIHNANFDAATNVQEDLQKKNKEKEEKEDEKAFKHAKRGSVMGKLGDEISRSIRANKEVREKGWNDPKTQKKIMARTTAWERAHYHPQ